MSNESNNGEYNEKLLSKLKSLEKKILDFLNVKLDIKLTGKEIKIDLNNKNIENIDLILLSGLNFENLEEIDLSNNNISDPMLIKEFIKKKVRKIDLSNNNFSDKILRTKFDFKKSEKINLTFNNINEIEKNEIIQENNKDIKNKNIDIILDKNNLIKKEIKEIKNIILRNLETYDDSENSNINSNNQKLNDIKLLSKLNRLEKKVLGYFNAKLNIQLTGQEIKLDLNNKHICDIELSLLSGVEFKNLEEIDLSHNNLTDIRPLKNFNKLNKIDLSNNIINDIKPLKEIIENNKYIKSINISNNLIYDTKILNNNIISYSIQINLDNNLIKKDIDEMIFDVNNRQLGDLGANSISHMKFNKIKEINISGNGIKNIKFLNNMDLKDLEYLDMSNNEIEDIEPIAKLNSIKLKKIFLQNNKIRIIDAFLNSKFPELEILRVDNNNLDINSGKFNDVLNSTPR